MTIVVFVVIYGLCLIRNKLIYELSWRSVNALTAGLFWYSLPSLGVHALFYGFALVTDSTAELGIDLIGSLALNASVFPQAYKLWHDDGKMRHISRQQLVGILIQLLKQINHPLPIWLWWHHNQDSNTILQENPFQDIVWKMFAI